MRNNNDDGRGHRDWRPIPDPTLLTNQLVKEAIANLESKLESRFNAMDKATTLLHDDYVRVPTEMDRQILHLRELLEAKVETVMALASQRAQSADIAVQAALNAAKDAVAAQNSSNAVAISKSESGTAESLRTLRDLFTAEVRAINAKVDDLRVTRDTHVGSEKTTADTSTRMIAILGLIIAVAIGVGEFLIRTAH